MSLLVRIILFAVAAGMLTGGAGSRADSRPAFLFFWSVSCPYCQQAQPFVKQLEKEHPELRFESWEVRDDPKGRARFADEVKRLKIQNPIVPTFICDKRYVVGFAKGASERPLRDLARELSIILMNFVNHPLKPCGVTMFKLALVGTVLVLPLVLACDRSPKPEPPSRAGTEPAQPAPATPPAEDVRSTPSVAAHMKDHFDKAADMKRALLRAKLDDYVKAAVWMAEHQLSADLPVTWKSHVEGMQNAAREARDAKDLKTASASFGAMGRACAVCHEQLGGPKIALGAPPAEGSGAALHMQRHQWAAERMWEGLMAPSDDAWVKGSEVMADAPLVPEAVSGPKSVPPEVKELANAAHSTAQRARTTETKDRGKAYGDMIATCTGCHDKLGISPK